MGNSENSYFDGGLLQLIGWSLLGVLITLCTFGIMLSMGLLHGLQLGNQAHSN